MPSSSAAQHRWIGHLHSDPEAAKRAGMSEAKVTEWLHADKGAPWKRADGGNVTDIARYTAKKYADGGGNIFGGASPASASPWFARREASDADSSHGFLMGSGPGRTDYRNATLPSGAYILPADVVSGLGEGNSLAGAAATDKMLHSEPYGIQPPSGGRGRGVPIPRPPSPREPILKGGGVHDGKAQEPVDAVLADGEVAVHPYVIAHHKLLGNLPLSDNNPEHFKRAVKIGHEVLDRFVVDQRAKHVAEIAKLAGPVGAKKHPITEHLRAAAKVVEAGMKKVAEPAHGAAKAPAPKKAA